MISVIWALVYESSSKKRYVQPGFHENQYLRRQIDGGNQLFGFLATNDVYKATGKIRGDSITLDSSHTDF